MTSQEQMEKTLAKSKIPARKIHCYGSQIMITALSYDAACKWAELLTPICRTIRCGQSIDETAENTGTCLLPSVIKVWRVWGTV